MDRDAVDEEGRQRREGLAVLRPLGDAFCVSAARETLFEVVLRRERGEKLCVFVCVFI